MREIRYSLREDVHLARTARGLFCLSRAPLVSVRVNEPLFRLLERLSEKGSVRGDSLWDNGRVMCERLVRKGFLVREENWESNDRPAVSVIIPVKDGAADLNDCLGAINKLIYPVDKLEVLVVDDASQDATFHVLQNAGVKSYRMRHSVGPGACRNLAARRASGEILAFLDSDCLPSPQWLKELVGHFQEPEVGAAGGYVDNYFAKTDLDLYERAFSPLNMGERRMRAGPGPSTFYLPSCNLLVRRDTFFRVDGFREGLRVGEDVDLCWRIRETGYVIHYSPEGRVYHKHRNTLISMLARRFDYGSSESWLMLHHPQRVKRMPLAGYDKAIFVVICVFLLFPGWLTSFPLVAIFGWDLIRKHVLVMRKGLSHIPFFLLLSATLRRGFLSFYVPSSFLVRYYLAFILLAAGLIPELLLAGAAFCFAALLGAKCSKRPAVSILPFTFYFFLEQLAYQCGVLIGCFQSRNWKPFLCRSNPCD